MVRRGAAVGAALAAGAGGIGLAVATGGAARVSEYVSESGAAGAPAAALYRASVLLLAAALALLAAAVRALSRPATGLLVAAAVFAVSSGTVTCSARCPLPPYEVPTPADLVHAGASIAAVALSSVAMLLLARTAADRAIAAGSRVGAAVAVPAQAAAGLAILVVGRGTLTGLLERAALLAVLGWLLAVAVARAVRR